SSIGLVATRRSSPANGVWWLCSRGGEEAMLAARTISRAVFFVLAIYLIGGIPTYSQSAALLSTRRIPGNRTGSEAWDEKCEVSSTNSHAALRLFEGAEMSPAINETGDSDVLA